MADGTLPPSEQARRENAVRVAALAAGQREGWQVPSGLLDRIVAASDWKLSQAELEMRAASTVERVMNDPQAPDFRNAPRDVADTYFKMVHGRLFGGFGGALWSLAEARQEAATSATSGDKSYASLETSWDASNPQKLTPKNWGKSPFASIGGLDIGTTQSLLAAGFRTEQIMQAGRDVNKLEIDTKENIARAARLNKEAPGFMPKAHRYKGDLDGVSKAEGAIAEDEARLAEMEKQGKANSQEAAALREHIARQKQEAERIRQEAEKRAEDAIKALPEARKEDGRGIIKAIRERNRHHRREFGAKTLTENHDARVAETKMIGAQEQVETATRQKLAAYEAKPDVGQAEQDELEAFAAKRETQAEVQKAANPPEKKETKTATAEPKQEQPAKPPVRQVATQSLAAPKV